MRRITVINQDTNNMLELETSKEALTLGELKNLLTERNFSYQEGSIFKEAISRIELPEDDSVLPLEVEYKGNKVTDLIVVIYKGNKKISSGGHSIERSSIYATIASDTNLKQYIKNITGRNYTNHPTKVLYELTNEFYRITKATPEVEKKPTTITIEEKVDHILEVVCRLEEALVNNKRSLSKEDIDEIINKL